jgi:hypothetical protein
MSLVYSWAPDAIYKNGTIAEWAKRNKLATARYPAGEASYYNWENPSGTMGNSTLDPKWTGPPRPKEDWMSLSEYLALCKTAGMRPLVGVNYNCGGENWVSKNESIARAVRQVAFVKAAGFPGAFYYIGNEDGAPRYADLIRAHAQAMKAVDPTLKVFWNDNGLGPAGLQKFLKATGDTMDGAEFHGKWPHGGKKLPKVFSVDDWLGEVPLVEHKTNQSWREKITGLRAAAKAAGRSDLLLANNEYGLGKPPCFGKDFDRYTKAMVVVEFALEMYVAGYDMAAFWDNSDGGHLDHAEHMLLDTQASYRMNPMHFGLEMLARASGSGGQHTMVAMNTSEVRVHGFAAIAKTNGTGDRKHSTAAERGTAAAGDQASGGGSEGLVTEILCYLINKNKQPKTVHLQMASMAGIAASATNVAGVPRTVGKSVSRTAKTVATAQSMVDTADHWGTMTPPATLSCSADHTSCSVILPPVSFTLLTYVLD